MTGFGEQPPIPEAIASVPAPVATSAAAPTVLSQAKPGTAPTRKPAPSSRTGDEFRSPQGGEGPPVSFDLKDADVQSVLRLLAGVSGKEIIATDDVKGTITLKLDNVPWDSALDMIAKTLNLSAERLGNVIRVTSAARAAADQEARERNEPVRTAVFRLRFARASSAASLLSGASPPTSGRPDYDRNAALSPDAVMSAGLVRLPRPPAPPTEGAAGRGSGLLTQRGRAAADDDTNTLIVADVQSGIDTATKVVAEIDQPAPQVQIESRIVEVSDSFERDLGVQWGYNFTASAATGSPTGYNFPGTLSFGGANAVNGVSPLNQGINPATGGLIPFLADFPAGGAFGAGNGSALDLVLGSIDGTQTLDLRLTQLEALGKLKVISRPRIITRNNQQSVIKSVDVIRVRLPQSTVLGGYAVGIAVQSIDVGIELRVRPQVSADGYVLLDLNAVAAQLDATQQVDNIPIEHERETESHVLLRNGQTLVVGGIYFTSNQFNTRGIPFLNGIPGLGWLFGGVSSIASRQDLVIFVTPREIALPGQTAVLPQAHQLWLNRNASGE